MSFLPVKASLLSASQGSVKDVIYNSNNFPASVKDLENIKENTLLFRLSSASRCSKGRAQGQLLAVKSVISEQLHGRGGVGVSHVVWMVVALACGIVEILTVGFWFLWLALAAVLVALFTWIGLTKSLAVQLAVFAGFTVFFTVFTRPLAMKFFKTRDVRSNVDSLIGKQAVVIKAISPREMGQVKIYGEVWTALADLDIAEGTPVIIRSVEGVKVKVEPVNQ